MQFIYKIILYSFFTLVLLVPTFVQANNFSFYQNTQSVGEGEQCGDVDQDARVGGIYYECNKGLSCNITSDSNLQPYGVCVTEQIFQCKNTGGEIYKNLTCNCPLSKYGGCYSNAIKVSHLSQYDPLKDEVTIRVTAKNTINKAISWIERGDYCLKSEEDLFGIRLYPMIQPLQFDPVVTKKPDYIIGNSDSYYEFTGNYNNFTINNSSTCASETFFNFKPLEVKKATIVISGDYLEKTGYYIQSKYGGSFEYESDLTTQYLLQCQTNDCDSTIVRTGYEPLAEEEKIVKFKDIDLHWAKYYIEKLAEDGFVEGYSNGMFYPNKNITRAEFTTILIRALQFNTDFPYNGAKLYLDVQPYDWYYNYVYIANINHFVDGYEDGNFRPNANITRAEAVALAMKAGNLNAYKYSHSYFYDVKQLWQIPYIETAYRLNLINGKGHGKFAPEEYLTRAEAVKIIVNILALEPSNIPEMKPLNTQTSWQK